MPSSDEKATVDDLPPRPLRPHESEPDPPELPRRYTSGDAGTSADGSPYYVMREWDLDLPEDAATTAAWLDQLTNATAELGPTTVSWQ